MNIYIAIDGYHVQKAFFTANQAALTRDRLHEVRKAILAKLREQAGGGFKRVHTLFLYGVCDEKAQFLYSGMVRAFAEAIRAEATGKVKEPIRYEQVQLVGKPGRKPKQPPEADALLAQFMMEPKPGDWLALISLDANSSGKGSPDIPDAFVKAARRKVNCVNVQLRGGGTIHKRYRELVPGVSILVFEFNGDRLDLDDAA